MGYIIEGFEPKRMFEYFEELSAIPRSSGHEEKVADFLAEFAEKQGLFYYRDAIHNVIIKKAGSKGCEHLPAIMLQGHTDMVCEKNADTPHDFATEGIQLIMENGLLRANGTTLGGDNGVAVALMMALLEDDFAHPPLECVFTVQEETGLTGAIEMDPAQISARTMINLDSEEEGIATVSCAGGMRVQLSRNCSWTAVEYPGLRISIRGLLGGHSGTDIGLERGNANKLMGRILYALYESEDIFLSDISGGSKDNAIPRECDAVIAFKNAGELGRAITRIQEEADAIYNELKAAEPDFRVNVEPFPVTSVMSSATAASLIRLLCLAPNGVRSRNVKAGGFIVSSLNLGVVQVQGEKVVLTFSPRSSIASQQNQTRKELLLLADLFGFDCRINSEYPGWCYQDNSTIRNIFKECYKQLTGVELRCEAIHAGLECGLFSQKIPGLDAIAIGPNIRGCHTPDEVLDLASFERTYQLVKAVLTRFTESV